MQEGIIVFYLPDKQYGYVRLPATREEFFFRGNQLTEPIKAGDRVRFEIRSGKTGYYAVNIRSSKLA